MQSYSNNLNKILYDYATDYKEESIDNDVLVSLAPPLPEDLVKFFEQKINIASAYPLSFTRMIMALSPNGVSSGFCVYISREGKELFESIKEEADKISLTHARPFRMDDMYGVIGNAYMGFFPDGAKEPDRIYLIIGANKYGLHYLDGHVDYEYLFNHKNHKLTIGDPRNHQWGLFKKLPETIRLEENAPFSCIHSLLEIENGLQSIFADFAKEIGIDEDGE